MTCLIVGASFDPKERFNYAMAHVEPFGMPFDGGDNTDGITVIDISNLDAVKYCFIFFSASELGDSVQTMTPLTGKEYVDTYERRNQEQSEDEDEDEDETRMKSKSRKKTKITGSVLGIPSWMRRTSQRLIGNPNTKAVDDALIDSRTLNSVWPDSSWGVLL